MLLVLLTMEWKSGKLWFITTWILYLYLWPKTLANIILSKVIAEIWTCCNITKLCPTQQETDTICASRMFNQHSSLGVQISAEKISLSVSSFKQSDIKV